MKKLIEKIFKKKEGKPLKGKLNNNKGFSLVELLIVIAIMGVLAVIAFNMFGGVLANSKKRADEQQARNIEKAILTYCIDSGDWGLAKGVKSGTTDGISAGDADDDVIGFFLNVIDCDGTEYGPVLSPRYPEDDPVESERNIEAFMPQWKPNAGGQYVGWNITIYKSKQTVKVTPVTAEDSAQLVIEE